ncbi:hypothetical protein J6590_005970, partial [Homalodisca vitripennis]
GSGCDTVKPLLVRHTVADCQQPQVALPQSYLALVSYKVQADLKQFLCQISLEVESLKKTSNHREQKIGQTTHSLKSLREWEIAKSKFSMQ